MGAGPGLRRAQRSRPACRSAQIWWGRTARLRQGYGGQAGPSVPGPTEFDGCGLVSRQAARPSGGDDSVFRAACAAPRVAGSGRGAGPFPCRCGGTRSPALCRTGGGDARAVCGEQRDPRHAHRLGQVARCGRVSFQGALRRRALGLHLPDQGAGEREIPGALPRLRAGERRHDDGRREREPPGAGAVLHGGDPGQHGACPWRRRGTARGDHGRIPLLLRSGTRHRLAGAAADNAALAVSVDVGDARPDGVLRARAGAADGRARGGGAQRRAAGAAGVRVFRDSADRAGGGPAGRGAGAGLPCAFHAARGGGGGAGPDEPRRVLEGGKEPRWPRRWSGCVSTALTAGR